MQHLSNSKKDKTINQIPKFKELALPNSQITILIKPSTNWNEQTNDHS